VNFFSIPSKFNFWPSTPSAIMKFEFYSFPQSSRVVSHYIMVSHASLQFCNWPCLTHVIFLMQGISCSFLTIIAVILSSTIVAKQPSTSQEEVLSKFETVTNSAYFNHLSNTTSTWLAKPPNTLLDTIIEVFMNFHWVSC
jgi:hypothetical protein